MIEYIELETLKVIHNSIIAETGGIEGVRDYNLLLSSINRPKISFAGQELYTTVWLKAASLIHSLVKNHGFIDGNIRTAYLSTLRFLSINGYRLDSEGRDIIDFVLAIAEDKLSLEQIAEWFKKHSIKFGR